MGRKGSVQSWDGSTGYIVDLDEGNMRFPVEAAEVTGSISEADIVDFEVSGQGANRSATSVSKVS